MTDDWLWDEHDLMIPVAHSIIRFDFERRDGTEFSRWYAYAPGEQQPDHSAPTLPELVTKLSESELVCQG